MVKKLNAQLLRLSQPQKKDLAKIKRQPLVLVLDNVQDTFNIGSFFRLADALAVEKLYLCGPTVTPPNIKIHRASIGTWKWVDWQHYPHTKDCLLDLKKRSFQIVAVEQNPQSKIYIKAKYSPPLALLIGNESTGLDPKLLKYVDQIVEIPMLGINRSLNALVAASVVSFHCLTSLHFS
jgi:23S rRNA (guanosine2251-2'-O)-methyltransferase